MELCDIFMKVLGLYMHLRVYFWMITLYIEFAPVTSTDPVFSPYLLPPKAALSLKYLLQHQPWNSAYELRMEETEDNEHVRQVNEQIDIMDRSVVTLTLLGFSMKVLV